MHRVIKYEQCGTKRHKAEDPLLKIRIHNSELELSNVR